MKKKKLKEKIKRLQLQSDMHQRCFEECQNDWSVLLEKNVQLRAKKDELENQLFEAQELINGKLKEIKELIATNLSPKRVAIDSINLAPIATLVSDPILPRYDEIVPKEQRSPEEERILCEQEHATVLPREMG